MSDVAPFLTSPRTCERCRFFKAFEADTYVSGKHGWCQWKPPLTIRKFPTRPEVTRREWDCDAWQQIPAREPTPVAYAT